MTATIQFGCDTSVGEWNVQDDPSLSPAARLSLREAERLGYQVVGRTAALGEASDHRLIVIFNLDGEQEFSMEFTAEYAMVSKRLSTTRWRFRGGTSSHPGGAQPGRYKTMAWIVHDMAALIARRSA